jgi:hypothetical protein
MAPVNTDKLVISAKAAFSTLVAALSLAGAITYGYGVQANRVDALAKAVDEDRRSMQHIVQALEGLDKRLYAVDKTAGGLVISIDALRNEINNLTQGIKRPHADSR